MRDAGRTPSKMSRYHRRMTSDPLCQSSMGITESIRSRVSRESKKLASRYQPKVVVTKTNLLTIAEGKQMQPHRSISVSTFHDDDDDQTDLNLGMEITKTSAETFVNSMPDINVKIEREEPPRPISDTNFEMKIDPENISCNSDKEREQKDVSKLSLSCSNCGKIYKNRKALRAHIRKAHDEKRQFKCGVCKKPFSALNDLIKHRHAAHYKIQYKCNVSGCMAKFAIPAALGTHQRSVHPEAQILKWSRRGSPDDKGANCTMQCEICWKTFTTVGHMKTHYEGVHLRIRKFECGICEQTYFAKNAAKRHRDDVHNGIRFPCDFPGCEKSYSLPKDVTRHQKIIHSKWHQEKSQSKRKC